jgi:hypothetical protein
LLGLKEANSHLLGIKEANSPMPGLKEVSSHLLGIKEANSPLPGLKEANSHLPRFTEAYSRAPVRPQRPIHPCEALRGQFTNARTKAHSPLRGHASSQPGF